MKKVGRRKKEKQYTKERGKESKEIEVPVDRQNDRMKE